MDTHFSSRDRGDTLYGYVRWNKGKALGGKCMGGIGGAVGRLP